MGNPEPTHRYTPEEYLKLELAAEYKNEYIDGLIFPMTSHTIRQNRITVNCMCWIHEALKDTDCTAYASSLKMRIEQPRAYLYPELSVVRDKAETMDEQYSLTNPILLVEVMSKETEAFDRGDKWHLYQRIPALEEYVLVSIYNYHVDVFYRLDQRAWRYDSYDGLDAIMELRSLGIKIPLADIYQRVEFES